MARSSLSSRWLILALPLWVGCEVKDEQPATDSADDSTAVDPGPEAVLTSAELVGAANMDDDDQDELEDWGDDSVEADNDLYAVPLDPAALAQGATLDLTLAGDLDSLRVWSDGAVLLDAETTTATVPAEGAALSVEYAGFLNQGTLSVSLLDADGVELVAEDLALLSAPLILNNHSQAAERVAVLEIASSDGNGPLVDSLESLMGDEVVEGQAAQYGYDVWVQDELEFATLTTPTSRVDVVIDSIRSKNGRYLDAYPEDLLGGPDVIIHTWGDGRASSQDSFGNLEVTPPVTVNGVDYPFGRIYYGDAGATTITEGLTDLLYAQKVQAPFIIDVSWLCVGHVDEFSTFLPDPTAPKGFRFYYADVGLAYDLLRSLDPTTSLPLFASGHGYDTVGDMLNDADLAAYNEDLQRDYIDPNLEIYKAEAGLDDEDIVLVPSLFERVSWCGGTGVALIPGTLNMEVAPMADGSTHVVIADPFLRTDLDDQSSDPLISAVTPLLPAGLQVEWVDDWDWYHMGLGEVHCGTNTQREPIGDWWTSARHLIEE